MQIKRRRSGNFKIQLLSNLVLSLFLLSIAAFCFFTVEEEASTGGKQAEIYRRAPMETQNVSLMFNVYWGTDEVYRILEILQKHDAKATFFIGGCWADDNVSCLKKIAGDGHEIGNHGYFHKDHSKMSLTANMEEIKACNQFVYLSLGVTPTLFAPPSGAYNNDTLSACQSLSMKTVLWSRDTIDWRDKDRSLIYARATKNIKGGEFVLMHPMEKTAEALDDIIEYYKKQSLTCVTVSQNINGGETG